MKSNSNISNNSKNKNSDRLAPPNELSHNVNSEVHEMNSINTIMNRNDTYKSNVTPRDGEDHKDNLDDIINIYRKKNNRIAMYPAIFHIITKKDMLSDAGLEDQTNRAESLKDDLIDEFFFVSCKDQDGIQDLLDTINTRRLEAEREEFEERESMRHMSKQSEHAI